MALLGNTLAVGAFGESVNGIGVNGVQTDGIDRSGAAYIFLRDGESWAQQAYIKASNTDVQDRFGYALALSEGLLAVSAAHENSGASGINGDQTDDSDVRSGAVYLFTRSEQTGSQSAYIKSSNNDDEDSGLLNFVEADRFGASIALSGETLAIGAPGEDMLRRVSTESSSMKRLPNRARYICFARRR